MTEPMQLKLRLYIAGDAPNSVSAVANLHDFCRDYLAGRCEIEIIDVLIDPSRALTDGVLLTPMLVKLSPAPVRQIIGSLSDRTRLQQAIGPPM